VFLSDLRELLNEDWTLEAMARECGVCTTHFVHYCRQITNRSPVQYLNDLRLQRAREILLEQPDMPIVDLAMICGFATSQYFASCFKRRYGLTPTALRASTLFRAAS
jgi:AraC family L-rhamnose operon regulatory protein RhaS